MNRRTRLALFAGSAAGLGALLVLAYLGLPDFGGRFHPYGARAVHAAVVDRHTANVVSSVNLDLRAADTLGEEMIFYAAVIGTLVLLRPSRHEARRPPSATARWRILDSTRLVSSALLPASLLIGGYITVHGGLTPGGGFQGGIIMATALHLLYLGGDYASLRRLRPWHRYEVLEDIGTAGYLVVGIAGLVATGSFLAANLLPAGTFGQLTSAGTVPVLNVAIGLAVWGGTVNLLSRFFEQEFEIRRVR